MNADKPISTLQVEVKAIELFKAQLDLKGEKLQKQIDLLTNLKTNQGLGSSWGDKNENQNTEIYLGSKMIWSIALSPEKGNEEYGVVLDSIKQPLGSEFFTEINKRNGDIVGDVTADQHLIGKGENYKIFFHITKGDEVSIVIPIDPRLRIKQ